MPAGLYNFVIEQGADFDLTLTWKDSAGAAIDLTGYTARMMIKTSVGGTQIASLTQASGITLGGALGTIAIHISAATTAAYTFTSAVYDLELVSASGAVTRLIRGAVSLSLEVTV